MEAEVALMTDHGSLPSNGRSETSRTEIDAGNDEDVLRKPKAIMDMNGHGDELDVEEPNGQPEVTSTGSENNDQLLLGVSQHGNGCPVATTPGSPEAVLQLDVVTATSPKRLHCNGSHHVPTEDVHEFNSNSAANVTCQLKTDAALPFARIQEELRKAHEELRLKNEEVGRLRCLRDEVGAELEDLTASLFQEAHKMVREAKIKRDIAEKGQAEAEMKIEVLMAEVQALKTLVLTSTPSMPNRHLHPQLKVEHDEEKNGISLLRGHKRSPSHNDLKYGRDSTPTGSPVKATPMPQPTMELREEYEVDPAYHQEFVSWRECPNSTNKEHPFLARIYKEDIVPCLNFNNTQLSEEVQRCIEENSIVIETVSGKSLFPKRCAMLDAPRLCKYRMKLGDSDQWHYISQLCRNRIASTCDFLSYLRYIQQGLVKNSVHEVYGEILHLRKKMAFAKLGFN